jgi:hypothetical protein
MVHVFDDTTLPVIMAELSTITDFLTTPDASRS